MDSPLATARDVMWNPLSKFILPGQLKRGQEVEFHGNSISFAPLRGDGSEITISLYFKAAREIERVEWLQLSRSQWHIAHRCAFKIPDLPNCAGDSVDYGNVLRTSGHLDYSVLHITTGVDGHVAPFQLRCMTTTVPLHGPGHPDAILPDMIVNSTDADFAFPKGFKASFECRVHLVEDPRWFHGEASQPFLDEARRVC